MRRSKRDPEADKRALEREMDELVYALYGITPAEINLVEHSTKRREGELHERSQTLEV